MERGFFQVLRCDFDTQSYRKIELIGFHQFLKNSVNLKAKEFRGITIYPGQFATSIANLASDIGRSVKSVRLMLESLQKDGLIKTESVRANERADQVANQRVNQRVNQRANRFSIISICNPHTYGLMPCMAGLTKGQAKRQTTGQSKGQTKGQGLKEFNNNITPLIVPPTGGETDPKNGKRKRFKKPTVEQIREYCRERTNNVDAEKFWNFYEAKGWKIGKTPMSDWKAAVRTWENKNKTAGNKLLGIF